MLFAVDLFERCDDVEACVTVADAEVEVPLDGFPLPKIKSPSDPCRDLVFDEVSGNFISFVFLSCLIQCNPIWLCHRQNHLLFQQLQWCSVNVLRD